MTLTAVATARARAAAYEGFDYPVGRTGSFNGGTGFPEKWNPSYFGSIVAGSLADPTGTLLTTGNRIAGQNIMLIRKAPAPVGTPGSDLWVSLLMSQAALGQGWHGLAITTTTQGPALPSYFVGEPGGGPADGNYVIGQAGDDETVVSSGVPFQGNVPVFLVAHFAFTDGNDAATLYVNPAPGAAAPAGGVTYGGFDFAPRDVSFILESSMLDPAPLATFDEFRVGSSYAEVAPALPEPAGAAGLALTAGALLLRRRQLRG
jgi:hypothetical protein